MNRDRKRSMVVPASVINVYYDVRLSTYQMKNEG